MFSPEYANIINNYLYAVNSLSIAHETLTANKMYDCYNGDASTVETSVFINAEILVRLFFQAITQKSFAVHRGAQTPFS